MKTKWAKNSSGDRDDRIVEAKQALGEILVLLVAIKSRSYVLQTTKADINEAVVSLQKLICEFDSLFNHPPPGYGVRKVLKLLIRIFRTVRSIRRARIVKKSEIKHLLKS